MKRKGFTLIELMIVVAIIAIIAAVAIPGLLRSRIGANESSAQGSLKSICTGQEQFKSGNCQDANANGVGEYGFLCELGGVNNVRQTNVSMQASPYIPRVLGQVSATFESSKAGYHFILYLPSGAATATASYAAGTAGGTALCETAYIAYGWPQAAGRSGVRLFCIDPQGQPYSSANAQAAYTGTAAGPAWDDAFQTATSWNSYIHDGGIGQLAANTGNWTPTG